MTFYASIVRGRHTIHTTPPTLLNRSARSPDEAAWRRLVQLYTPLLFFWARRAGRIQNHDAADLVQEVFVALLQTLPTFQYDRQGGKFRGLAADPDAEQIPRSQTPGRPLEKALLTASAGSGAARRSRSLLGNRVSREVTHRALRLMQTEFTPTTWKACWETVVQGRPAAEVAQELGITENAVYLAKCRVLRRLRQELAGLVE